MSGTQTPEGALAFGKDGADGTGFSFNFEAEEFKPREVYSNEPIQQGAHIAHIPAPIDTTAFQYDFSDPSLNMARVSFKHAYTCFVPVTPGQVTPQQPQQPYMGIAPGPQNQIMGPGMPFYDSSGNVLGWQPSPTLMVPGPLIQPQQQPFYNHQQQNQTNPAPVGNKVQQSPNFTNQQQQQPNPSKQRQLDQPEVDAKDARLIGNKKIANANVARQGQSGGAPLGKPTPTPTQSFFSGSPAPAPVPQSPAEDVIKQGVWPAVGEKGDLRRKGDDEKSTTKEIKKGGGKAEPVSAGTGTQGKDNKASKEEKPTEPSWADRARSNVGRSIEGDGARSVVSELSPSVSDIKSAMGRKYSAPNAPEAPKQLDAEDNRNQAAEEAAMNSTDFHSVTSVPTPSTSKPSAAAPESLPTRRAEESASVGKRSERSANNAAAAAAQDAASFSKSDKEEWRLLQNEEAAEQQSVSSGAQKAATAAISVTNEEEESKESVKKEEDDDDESGWQQAKVRKGAKKNAAATTKTNNTQNLNVRTGSPPSTPSTSAHPTASTTTQETPQLGVETSEEGLMNESLGEKKEEEKKTTPAATIADVPKKAAAVASAATAAVPTPPAPPVRNTAGTSLAPWATNEHKFSRKPVVAKPAVGKSTNEAPAAPSAQQAGVPAPAARGWEAPPVANVSSANTEWATGNKSNLSPMEKKEKKGITTHVKEAPAAKQKPAAAAPAAPGTTEKAPSSMTKQKEEPKEEPSKWVQMAKKTPPPAHERKEEKAPQAQKPQAQQQSKQAPKPELVASTKAADLPENPTSWPTLTLSPKAASKDGINAKDEKKEKESGTSAWGVSMTKKPAANTATPEKQQEKGKNAEKPGKKEEEKPKSEDAAAAVTTAVPTAPQEKPIVEKRTLASEDIKAAPETMSVVKAPMPGVLKAPMMPAVRKAPVEEKEEVELDPEDSTLWPGLGGPCPKVAQDVKQPVWGPSKKAALEAGKEKAKEEAPAVVKEEVMKVQQKKEKATPAPRTAGTNSSTTTTAEASPPEQRRGSSSTDVTKEVQLKEAEKTKQNENEEKTNDIQPNEEKKRESSFSAGVGKMLKNTGKFFKHPWTSEKEEKKEEQKEATPPTPAAPTPPKATPTAPVSAPEKKVAGGVPAKPKMEPKPVVSELEKDKNAWSATKPTPKGELPAKAPWGPKATTKAAATKSKPSWDTKGSAVAPVSAAAPAKTVKEEEEKEEPEQPVKKQPVWPALERAAPEPAAPEPVVEETIAPDAWDASEQDAWGEDDAVSIEEDWEKAAVSLNVHQADEEEEEKEKEESKASAKSKLVITKAAEESDDDWDKDDDDDMMMGGGSDAKSRREKEKREEKERLRKEEERKEQERLEEEKRKEKERREEEERIAEKKRKAEEKEKRRAEYERKEEEKRKMEEDAKRKVEEAKRKEEEEREQRKAAAAALAAKRREEAEAASDRIGAAVEGDDEGRAVEGLDEGLETISEGDDGVVYSEPPKVPEIGPDGIQRYPIEVLLDFKKLAQCKKPCPSSVPPQLHIGAEPPAGENDLRMGYKGKFDRNSAGMDRDDWRAGKIKTSPSRVGTEKRIRRRELEPQLTLNPSSSSWSCRQKEDNDDPDKKFIRQMKSIMNKLTIEKFDKLYGQLMECGFTKKEHIEALMKEVFEKATTQHHFIDMYTQLCLKIHEWLQEKNNHFLDSESSFKRILLNQCQDSFVRYLKQPEEDESLTPEERFEKRCAYKMTMLGNVKLVAQLLIGKMLSSKIIFTCTDELLNNKNEETLETLVAFLIAIGPTFGVKEWGRHEEFLKVIAQVKKLSESNKITPRIKCLLKDVLDLQANNWQNTKPTEGPTHLAAVRDQWIQDNKSDPKFAETQQKIAGQAKRTEMRRDDEWNTVPKRK